MDRDMNVEVIVKGVERYVFLYDGEEGDIVGAARGLVNNAELNFSDYDVDCLAKKVCSGIENL
ncbi:hypothetical protein HOE04_04640 [archaeon]|jgi:hypothetical protein|nr:hypothetical protein [archaeon]